MPARTPARLGAQLLGQAAAILGLALDAGDELGIAGDEGQIEQLGDGLLLGVDAFLSVALERRRLLDRVERAARPE